MWGHEVLKTPNLFAYFFESEPDMLHFFFLSAMLKGSSLKWFCGAVFSKSVISLENQD